MSGVTDIDRGWKGIQSRLRRMDGAHSKIGIQQGTTRENEGVSGTSDMVIIAAANEFGAPKRSIPARPFMRNAFDKNRQAIGRLQDKLFGAVTVGNVTPEKALSMIGEMHKGQVQKEIVDLQFPPNVPSTIKRKGSSNPLIDTGQLRQSIQHVEMM